MRGTNRNMQTRLRWCLLAIAPLALLSSGLTQEKEPQFSITISAPQTVKAGATVPLVIAVKNISTAQIGFLTDVSSALVFDFLFHVQDSDGKEPLETPYYQEAQGKDPHTTVSSRLHKGKKGIRCRPVKP
jgi:hypothetical protein